MPLKRCTKTEYKKRVCAAMNYISHNLDQELTLEEIAKEATFSPYHFHRIFKAVTGETISEFIKRLRLEKAACILSMNNTKNITRIAFDCNFSSSQNFAKAFRNHFGMSPSEFRKQNCKTIITDFDENLFFNSGNNNNSIFGKTLDIEKKLKMNVKITERPESRVAYVRKVGKYCKKTCEPAFQEIISWAIAKGLNITEKFLAIYWDNPEITPPEKCRMDACVTLPADLSINNSKNVQIIASGTYAIFHHEISETEFQEAWFDSFKWIIENEYECDDRIFYEQYNNNPLEHPEGKYIINICIPLRRSPFSLKK